MKAGEMMDYQTCADTRPLETEYLIGSPMVPKGDVSLVFGEGSVGKGRLIMSWIAQVINSDPSAVVIVVLPEDHPAEQVVPRLLEAGVSDLSRVVNLTRLPGGSRFKLSAAANQAGHIGILRTVIEEINAAVRGKPRRHVAMVVIDPLASVVGWGSIQTNAGARRLLEPIQDLCGDLGIAGVVVAHTVTGGKLQGSMGLSQAARVIYRIHKDPTNPTVRLISIDKANNLPDAESLRYVIEDSDGNGPKVIMLTAAEIERRQSSWRKPQDAGAQSLVLAALHSAVAPLTVAQVADMTGLGAPTARTALWRMGQRGQVAQVAGGWRIVRVSSMSA
jgi:hypothetical protein